MFSGATIEGLGQEAGDLMDELIALRQEHNVPDGAQATYLLHQARQNLRRTRAFVKSYQLAATGEPGDPKRVWVQKGFDDAEACPVDTFGGPRICAHPDDAVPGDRTKSHRRARPGPKGIEVGADGRLR